MLTESAGSPLKKLKYAIIAAEIRNTVARMVFMLFENCIINSNEGLAHIIEMLFRSTVTAMPETLPQCWRQDYLDPTRTVQ